MSDKNLARRSTASISFNRVDITKSILPYFLSLTYTDCEEDESDDLQIKLQDRDDIWLQNWLSQAIDAAVSDEGIQIHAAIHRLNWYSDGKDDSLDCGDFELDNIVFSGPPSTITAKATSLPYSSQIRQTKKSRAWEAYLLSGIAKEIALSNGLKCMFLCSEDPRYDRIEQYKTSDISFLSRLCHNEGISLKVTNQTLVLFDQIAYEATPSIRTFKKGDKSYLKWKLSSGKAATKYTLCRVSYTLPNGEYIEGTAYVEDYSADSKNNRLLKITAKVSSIGEAQRLAAKMLRLHNKFGKTISFTTPGDITLVSGVTVDIVSFGAFDGKYIINRVQHTLSASGYTTQIDGRKILEGY